MGAELFAGCGAVYLRIEKKFPGLHHFKAQV
jgi:hypothetical protein